MRCFTAISLLVLCTVATSHGFAIGEKQSLVTGAVDTISSLKQSAEQKKEGIIGNVQDSAKSKWDFVAGIKEAKISAVKNAFASKYSKLAALRAAKQAFVGNFVADKTAPLVDAYSVISSKAQGLHQYKINLKDKAISVVGAAASKVYSKINQKKPSISTTEKPESANEVVVLQPVVPQVPITVSTTEKPESANEAVVLQPIVPQEPATASTTDLPESANEVLALQPVLPQEPINVQTYVSYEPAIVGKVFVPEIPVQIYEQPHMQFVYGPPANTYGPPANTYGPSIIPL